MNQWWIYGTWHTDNTRYDYYGRASLLTTLLIHPGCMDSKTK